MLAILCQTASAAIVLDGFFFTFRTGGNPRRIVDRFEARTMTDGTVQFFRNGPIGSTSRINPATAQPMESYRLDGTTLTRLWQGERVTGTVSAAVT